MSHVRLSHGFVVALVVLLTVLAVAASLPLAALADGGAPLGS
jgi:hypothetical protein